MKKNKIVIFVHGLSGGVGQVITNYFSHMTPDFDIDIVTMYIESNKLKDQYEKLGMNIIKIPSKKESIYRNYRAIDNLFKKKKYDIAYAHMTLTNFFPLYIAKKNHVQVRISHSHLAEKKNLVKSFFSLSTQKSATDYLACGEAAGKFLYGDNNFKVFPNAIDLKKFMFDKAIRKKEREKLHINEDTTVIGNVGRFEAQKNHQFILKVFKKYHDIHKNSVLLLIGDGPLKNKIESLAKEYNLENSIIFMGQIKDVNLKLQAMDIFLLPSLYEGLPLGAIEAQAAGLPCLFADTISKESAVTSYNKFESLKKGPDVWVKDLERLKGSNRNTKKELQDNGYDINIEAKKLEKYLKEKIENKK